MRTIHRDIVSALIISTDQKLLMGMKDPAKGGVYTDCWRIPGGGVDEGEDKMTALRREMMEEVGLDITDLKVTLIDDKGSGAGEKTLESGEKVKCEMSFHIYRVDLKISANDANISLNDDLVKIEWVRLDQLNRYKSSIPRCSASWVSDSKGMKGETEFLPFTIEFQPL